MDFLDDKSKLVISRNEDIENLQDSIHLELLQLEILN